ncbi:radical SAM protein [Myxococcota bacterium]|nr:radical SAM protein [Myxococcota bacterium]MBU1535049.1 radical SAM protein [Myxococcota bacterium]
MLDTILHKAMSLRWSLYQKLETDLHELRYFFWETTRLCNLNCIHCGSDCSKDHTVTGLGAEVVIDTFTKIAAAHDPAKIMVVMTGGEPLVRPDLFPILESIGQLGFKMGMVTNGYTLDATMANRLARVGITSIVVSLDGAKADHDWLRNREGSYERATSALRHLVAAGIPIVEAITCVTPRTAEHLEEIYEIVKGTGALYWRVFNIFPIGRAAHNEAVLLTPEQFVGVVKSMELLRARGKKEGMEVNLSEEGFLGWDHESKTRTTPYFCRAGVNIAGLMADGTIAACPNLPAWMGQGNILTDDFNEVWKHRYQIFRDRAWMGKGKCQGCDQFSVCQGNSLHVWDPDKEGPVWCHYDILHPNSGEPRDQ